MAYSHCTAEVLPLNICCCSLSDNLGNAVSKSKSVMLYIFCRLTKKRFIVISTMNNDNDSCFCFCFFASGAHKER